MTADWLAVLGRHLAAGGRIMIEVPVEGLSRRDIPIIARTFEHATSSPCAWQLAQTGEPRLLLEAGETAPANGRGVDRHRWYPIEQLIGENRGGQIHCVRRNLLDHGPAEDAQSVVAWLAERAGDAATAPSTGP